MGARIRWRIHLDVFYVIRLFFLTAAKVSGYRLDKFLQIGGKQRKSQMLTQIIIGIAII